MRKIFTIGETVLDIIFKQSQPVAAKPGGAMLNTSVSLGRLGLPVHFISEYGTDKVGKLVDDFLKKNNVNTNHVFRYSNGRTSLAMAFLGDDNNASYDFYKIYPESRLDISVPDIENDDLVMFGSFYGITPEIRSTLIPILKKSKTNNSVIYYDPNFRRAHLHELDKLKPLIIENMKLADIVRCSNEDMEIISGSFNSREAYSFISNYCPVMIYTDSKKGVFIHTPSVKCAFDVKKIEPISTIGAGDTFNAGIAYGLIKNNIRLKDLISIASDVWYKIIPIAVDFATEVCLSYDNYLSKEYAEKVTAHNV